MQLLQPTTQGRGAGMRGRLRRKGRNISGSVENIKPRHSSRNRATPQIPTLSSPCTHNSGGITPKMAIPPRVTTRIPHRSWLQSRLQVNASPSSAFISWCASLMCQVLWVSYPFHFPSWELESQVLFSYSTVHLNTTSVCGLGELNLYAQWALVSSMPALPAVSASSGLPWQMVAVCLIFYGHRRTTASLSYITFQYELSFMLESPII